MLLNPNKEIGHVVTIAIVSVQPKEVVEIIMLGSRGAYRRDVIQKNSSAT